MRGPGLREADWPAGRLANSLHAAAGQAAAGRNSDLSEVTPDGRRRDGRLRRRRDAGTGAGVGASDGRLRRGRRARGRIAGGRRQGSLAPPMVLPCGGSVAAVGRRRGRLRPAQRPIHIPSGPSKAGSNRSALSPAGRRHFALAAAPACGVSLACPCSCRGECRSPAGNRRTTQTATEPALDSSTKCAQAAP